jgi:hypothetical protein
MRKAVFVVGFASVARHAGRDDRSDWSVAEGRMRSIQGGSPTRSYPSCILAVSSIAFSTMAIISGIALTRADPTRRRDVLTRWY